MWAARQAPAPNAGLAEVFAALGDPIRLRLVTLLRAGGLPIIWEKPSSIGNRVIVIAESLADAKRKLESEYGEGTVFNLHTEIDAAKPR